MTSNPFPHHENYSSGANVPAALRIIGFLAARVPIKKVSTNSSRSK